MTSFSDQFKQNDTYFTEINNINNIIVMNESQYSSLNISGITKQDITYDGKKISYYFVPYNTKIDENNIINKLDLPESKDNTTIDNAFLDIECSYLLPIKEAIKKSSNPELSKKINLFQLYETYDYLLKNMTYEFTLSNLNEDTFNADFENKYRDIKKQYDTVIRTHKSPFISSDIILSTKVEKLYNLITKNIDILIIWVEKVIEFMNLYIIQFDISTKEKSVNNGLYKFYEFITFITVSYNFSQPNLVKKIRTYPNFLNTLIQNDKFKDNIHKINKFFDPSVIPPAPPKASSPKAPPKASSPKAPPKASSPKAPPKAQAGTINEDILKEYIKCKLIKSSIDFFVNPSQVRVYNSDVEKQNCLDLYVYKFIISTMIKTSYNCDLNDLENQIKGIPNIDELIKLGSNFFDKDNQSLIKSIIPIKDNTNSDNVNKLREKIIKMYELDYLYQNYITKIDNTFDSKPFNLFNTPKIEYQNLPSFINIKNRFNVDNKFNKIINPGNKDLVIKAEERKNMEEFKLVNIKNIKINGSNQILRTRIDNFISLYKQYIDAKVELLFTGDQTALDTLFKIGKLDLESDEISQSQTIYSKLYKSYKLKNFDNNSKNDNFNNEYKYKFKLLHSFNKYSYNDELKKSLCRKTDNGKCADIKSYVIMYKNIMEYLYPEDIKAIADFHVIKGRGFTFNFKDYSIKYNITVDKYDKFIKSLSTENIIYYPEFINSIVVVEKLTNDSIAAAASGKKTS